MSLRFTLAAAIALATISTAEAGPLDAAAAGAVAANNQLSQSITPTPFVLAAPQLLAAPPVLAAPAPFVPAAPAPAAAADRNQ